MKDDLTLKDCIIITLCYIAMLVIVAIIFL